jgi:hypothetical protein
MLQWLPADGFLPIAADGFFLTVDGLPLAATIKSPKMRYCR